MLRMTRLVGTFAALLTVAACGDPTVGGSGDWLDARTDSRSKGLRVEFRAGTGTSVAHGGLVIQAPGRAPFFWGICPPQPAHALVIRRRAGKTDLSGLDTRRRLLVNASQVEDLLKRTSQPITPPFVPGSWSETRVVDLFEHVAQSAQLACPDRRLFPLPGIWLDEFLHLHPVSPSRQADDPLRLARRYRQAAADLSRHVSLRPAEDPARPGFLTAHSALLKRARDMLYVLREALQRNTKRRAAVGLELGHVHRALGQPREALAALSDVEDGRNAANRQHLTPAHFFLRGDLHAIRGEMPDAWRSFAKALARDPDHAEAEERLGLSLVRARKFDASTYYLERALARTDTVHDRSYLLEQLEWARREGLSSSERHLREAEVVVSVYEGERLAKIVIGLALRAWECRRLSSEQGLLLLARVEEQLRAGDGVSEKLARQFIEARKQLRSEPRQLVVEAGNA